MSDTLQVPERTPLLRRSSSQSLDQSACMTLTQNIYTTPTGLLVHFGLLMAFVSILSIVTAHPAGLFSWHPPLQALALLAFTNGIMVLQPTSTQQEKKRGFQLHRILQPIGSIILTAGIIIMIVHKSRSAHPQHFTTWHGKFGLITYSMVVLQGVAGFVAVYVPSLLGGESNGRKAYKYHRVLGYVTMTLFIITPLLAATKADWVLMNSTAPQRMAIIVGLVLTGLGLLVRIKPSKMNIKQDFASR